MWDVESQTLKSSYQEALNREIITGRPEDKQETAIKKKAYDSKLKTLKKQLSTD